MAVTVIENLVAGHRLRYSYNGRELKRLFFVDGLTPGAGTLIQAAAATGIPAFASVHPNDANLIADDFDVEPWPATSFTSARVTVLYHFATLSPTFQPIIELTATGYKEETNYDVDGDPIVVNYEAPDGTSISPSPIGKITQMHRLAVLTIERVEYDDPTPRLAYFNKLNSEDFWGQPKWTWCITDISIRKLRYTSGFSVKYTLEYDPKTHVKTAIYRDNLTGDIPGDVDTNPDPLASPSYGNGWTNVLAEHEADYSGLSLPSGFAA